MQTKSASSFLFCLPKLHLYVLECFKVGPEAVGRDLNARRERTTSALVLLHDFFSAKFDAFCRCLLFDLPRTEL